MLFFSNAKINLGLHITSKRSDGYHNIETVFYPVGLKDVIEFIPSDEFHFENQGFQIDCLPENNIIIKAYQVLKTIYDLPPLHFYIHKNIPFGAGLGGGSSNASFVLKNLISYFKLNVEEKELLKIAENLGSDCPFFLENKPAFATSKGEVLRFIDLDLSTYKFAIIKPPVNINTKEAYQKIIPTTPKINLTEILQKPVAEWKDIVKNDFEKVVFPFYPEIKEVKEKLYDLGAEFSLMSGSGASVFGIFTSSIDLSKEFPSNYFTWMEKEKG